LGIQEAKDSSAVENIITTHDDIYKTDHMSNYDMTMEIEDSSNLHGWTAPRSKHGMHKNMLKFINKECTFRLKKCHQCCYSPYIVKRIRYTYII